MDGVIDTADSIKANIENMTGAMIGRLIYSGGKFEIHAGEYVAPTVTIDESMMVGEISVQTKQSRRNAYNGVKGVFLSEDDNYILADYPAQISSTYATQDGDPIYLDMPLPYTINNIRAQRIAQLALRRSRQQEAITIPCNLNAFKFKIGDNINVSNTRLGYSSKVFEVVGYSFGFSSDQMVVNVEAIETASSIWSWDEDEEAFLGAGEVDLYDGTSTAPTSFSGTASTTIDTDGTAIGKIVFSWTSSDDAFVSQYDFQYSTDNSNWNAIDVTGTQFTVEPTLGAVTYYAKVRAINDSGARSSFVTAQATAVGDTTAPAIPSGVTASGGASQVSISWTNPSDKDFSNVTVFRATSSGGTYTEIATVGGGWGSAGEFVNGGLAGNVEYFYKLKAVDYSGNASGFSSMVSGTTLAVSNTGVTVVDDATGNTDATVTVTRVANGSVLIGIDWSIRKASGAPDEVTNPFPVTLTLKRDSTTIKTWSATGTFTQGSSSQGEPFFIIGDLSASWYDTDTGSGSTTYTLSATTLNTSHFSLTAQLSAQPSL